VPFSVVRQIVGDDTPNELDIDAEILVYYDIGHRVVPAAKLAICVK